MAQLVVRRIESEVVARLKERAGRHGHSAEEEHRAILRAALLSSTPIAATSFEEYLMAMPDVGEDEEFGRIAGADRIVDLGE